jgi:predicted metal-dependent phosphoesterase TrpH
MGNVDLHIHSTASDGKDSPQEILQRAAQKGLHTIAITDHDTVAGVTTAMKAAQPYNVEVIPGIELSTVWKGRDIHILGYYLDYTSLALQEDLNGLRGTRHRRNQMLIEQLNKLGLDITLAEAQAKQTDPQGNLGRPHIAEVLVEKGYVSSIQEAFNRYLGQEGKAYINPPRISPFEGIQLVLRYGGIPVLAHPGLYQLDEIINELKEHGLQGIEVYHPDHDEAAEAHYLKIAQQFGLIVTGGSDYHGEREGTIFHADIGSQKMNYSLLSKLKDLNNPHLN